MKTLALLCTASIVIGLSAGPVDARVRPHVRAHHAAHETTCTFRVHVSGTPDPRMTFWAAYGPLHGRFGVLRLHSAGAGTYAAQQTLPDGTTAVTFLAGVGTVHTREGAAPGNPVVTIRSLPSVSISSCSLPTVEWQAPVG